MSKNRQVSFSRKFQKYKQHSRVELQLKFSEIRNLMSAFHQLFVSKVFLEFDE